MLKGLEVAEVKLSELEFSGRIDSEYYRKEFLELENLIKSKPNCELQEVANFLIGPFGSAFNTENYISEGEYRYVRGQDVKPFVLKDGENRYIPEEDFVRLSKYALKERDILVSVVGTLGNACIVQPKELPAIFSCKSTVIRTKEINPVYLLSYLNSNYGHSLLLRKERGAIQKGLNLDDLKTTLIPKLNDDFQEAIENIFYQAQEKLEQSKATILKAENDLKDVLGLNSWTPSQESITVKRFSNSFGDSGRLDAEFYQPFYDEVEAILKSKGYALLENICSEINYGTVPTSPYTEDGTGVPYIKGTNFKNTIIDSEGLDRIVNTEDLPKKFYTKEGDIIISQMGTVGDTGVVEKNQEGWLFASFTIRVRIKDKKNYDPHFVAFYIQHIAKPYYLHRFIAQASVRQNTDLPTIKNLYVPKLPIETQKEISKLIKQSFKQRQESTHLLDITKQAVEIAIEQDEQTAMKFIKDNT